MTMTKDVKNVIKSMIITFIANNYKCYYIDLAALDESLKTYNDSELFNKVFLANDSFENFVNELIADKWYAIAADKCNVSSKEFADFMNSEDVNSILKKYGGNWMDCLAAAMSGNKDVCDAIYGEINGKSEMVDENKQYRALRVQENCIEIAMNIYQEIYDKTDLPRDVIIGKIQDWAEEAEKEWENAERRDEYIDFIDAFSKKKKEAFLDEWMESDIKTDNKTNNADMAHLIAQECAIKYTYGNSVYCDCEDVAKAIEEAINEYNKTNNNN